MRDFVFEGHGPQARDLLRRLAALPGDSDPTITVTDEAMGRSLGANPTFTRAR